MKNHHFFQDFETSRQLLADLLKNVIELEGTLAGGVKLGKGGEAIEGVLETKVSFGNPNDNLTRLDSRLFNDLGIPLSPVQKDQLGNNRFDFYYMTLTVSIQPKRGATFSRVECKLDFDPEKTGKPIVQTYFPVRQWKELLSLGIGIKLALNGNLDWRAQVEGLTAPQLKLLPLHIQANVVNEGELHAFVTTPNYVFTLGKSEITATGEGDSFCLWSIEKFNLRKEQTIKFVVVFKVPKGMEKVNLIGQVRFYPSTVWLLDKLRGVSKYLTQEFQTVLQPENDKERLFIGDHEGWQLSLPQS